MGRYLHIVYSGAGWYVLTLPVRPDAILRGHSAGFTGMAEPRPAVTACVATLSILEMPSRILSRSQPSSRTSLSRKLTNQASSGKSPCVSGCVGSLHTRAKSVMLAETAWHNAILGALLVTPTG